MKKILASVLFLAIASVCAAINNQVDTISLSTRYIASPAKAVVAVPESYLQQTDTARYPVVYLLHGYSDDYSYYSKKMDLAATASRYGVIIVCPDGRNSWYWDSPIDPNMQMESFIVSDLVPAIDRDFRTIPTAASRAITGLSMGGQGAIWLAIRHPDIWKNVATMSGGVDITKKQFHKKWTMAKRLGTYDENPQRWQEHSIVNLVKNLEPQTLNIMVVCGTEDFFYDVNCDLDHELNRHKIGHTFVTAPGNHSWNYWGKVIFPILDFFTENF